MKVGVIAVQGAVSEHIDALTQAMKSEGIKGKAVPVRVLEDLSDIDGLVIPGGESTTIGRLTLSSGLHGRIVELAQGGLPILGTCAGTILLASEGDRQVKDTDTKLLGLLDMQVNRNSYGRQVDSFEAGLQIAELGRAPFKGVFIRAPTIEKVWGKTEVWAKYQNKIVGAKKGNILALTFHPEITEDLRIHQFFLKQIES
ncbi:MAG: pyridoxal 5'-phosphate synthase glutaminase subunit PdxT [Candidatus Bathyarchaeota archaeon]|nr:pyridoxal 5'-phosphate synthase glutaminase subunit PdxT [Candidatus Bathyarchaeota archaeon]